MIMDTLGLNTLVTSDHDHYFKKILSLVEKQVAVPFCSYKAIENINDHG
jgi:hypothetical protein